MRVLQLGAAGFVPKSLDTNMLSDAITFVLQGGVYIPTKLLSQSQKEGLFTDSTFGLPQPTPKVHLTQRQQDVLRTLARGLPVKRICRELNLSEGTVKTHISAIYRASARATAPKRSSPLAEPVLTSFFSPSFFGFLQLLVEAQKPVLQLQPAFAESPAWPVLRYQD